MKFGPDRRVRKRPEFQRIQARGKRVNTRDFILIFSLSTDPKAESRLGITASKKVGNSVQRNRLKRIVRATFRQLPALVPRGYDLVVICRRRDAELTTQTAVQQWKNAQKRVRIALAQLLSASS